MSEEYEAGPMPYTTEGYEHGPMWVVPPVGRGNYARERLLTHISDDTDPPNSDIRFRVDHSGVLWHWTGSGWDEINHGDYVIDPRVLERLRQGTPTSWRTKLRSKNAAWPVFSDGVEICQVDAVGDDGLPIERVVIDGVVYERCWSMTEDDWVYAS